MAENTPLGVVLNMVKAQCGFGPPGTNQAEDQRLYQLIDTKQRWLADEWDWPTLAEWWDAGVGAGVRYPTLPTASDQDGATAGTLPFNKRRPLGVWVKWNSYWDELEYGISELQEYNAIDSDIGQQQDPIQRWAYNDTTTFEVWPVPASQQTVRFRGQRILNSLFVGNVQQSQAYGASYDPTATLDLDDTMVTLFVVADYLMATEDGQTLGKAKLQEGLRQMNRVRAQEPKRERRYVLGRAGEGEKVRLVNVKIIAVAGQPAG